MDNCNCKKKPSLFWLIVKLIASGGLLLLFIVLVYIQLEADGVISEVGSILSHASNMIPYNRYFMMFFFFFGVIFLARRFWIYLQND